MENIRSVKRAEYIKTSARSLKRHRFCHCERSAAISPLIISETYKIASSLKFLAVTAVQRFAVSIIAAILLFTGIVSASAESHIPDTVRGYRKAAANHFIKNEYQKAFEAFDKVVGLIPDDPVAYYDRANVLLMLFRYDKAMEGFNKAIELDPDYVRAYNVRGIVYARDLDLIDLAMDDFNKAIEINPEYADSYTNRANTFLSLEDLDNAMADYNKAIELQPKKAKPYLSRATIYVRQNELIKAKEDVETFLKYAPPSFKKQIDYANELLRKLKEAPPAPDSPE